jgi:hypothetical protein
MLDFPREVAVTELTLGHFIGASKAIVEKAAAIKELASRAEVYKYKIPDLWDLN